ncbi:hypothetical protein G7Z17_g2016 [Cylindrodendrum hubeiense]|uniref:FAD/NAD(P)-binding domain-containing protein n=1 Tax=Cylindrodendrum hubeiense TaxID=595255 RepID=A0A9P5HII4_9HYPO|nr:hypothetical protein G7Z17_g2016 [Cylindrodendrum hubeiense]
MGQPVKILVAGGSYAGLSAASHLYDLVYKGQSPAACEVEITVVDERDGYSTGLRRNWPAAPRSLNRHEHLSDVHQHISSIQKSRHVVVVGGGAVGVEMASEMKLLYPDLEVTLAHSRDKLLSSEPLPEVTKQKILQLLKELGVRVLLGHRLEEMEAVQNDDGEATYNLSFSNGLNMSANSILHATSGSSPSTEFLPSAAVDSKGYVKVQPSLMFDKSIPNHQYHFSAGDINRWSGIKRCGVAMHGGQIVAHNIYQQILKDKLNQEPNFKDMDQVPPMIALAIGNSAVAYAAESGTTWGRAVRETYFGQDYCWSFCWNQMGLNGSA